MKDFIDFQFNYKNNQRAGKLVNFRPWLPTFFYPDWRGGYINPTNGYWVKKSVLSDKELTLRNNITDKWIKVLYKQNTLLPGFDIRETTTRQLIFQVTKLEEMSIKRIMSVAEAYQSYLNCPLHYKINNSNSLSNLRFLRIQLEMQRGKL